MPFPDSLAWDERGLLPAVVQDADTGVVLMVAWMNRDAFERTRETGYAHFYSRSRQALWKKGETSGNVLAVRELRVDCDADTLLVRAQPAGPTCHTQATSCFFHAEDVDDDGPPAPAATILDRLERVLLARRDDASPAKSYTRSLLDGGASKIGGKIREEAGELVDELPAGERKAVVHETADLLFHVLVGLVARDIPAGDVWSELERRFGVSGHDEKAARK